MKYFPGSIVSLDVFRLIGRCQRDRRRGNLHPVSGRPRHSRHFVISDTYFRLYAFKNEELIGTRLPELPVLSRFYRREFENTAQQDAAEFK